MAKKNSQVQTAISEAMSDYSTSRYRNPYFWVGVGGLFLLAMGVDAETLTSWKLVGEAVMNFISNPVAIFSTGITMLGVFVDPTTKGVTDKK